MFSYYVVQKITKQEFGLISNKVMVVSMLNISDGLKNVFSRTKIQTKSYNTILPLRNKNTE